MMAIQEAGEQLYPLAPADFVKIRGGTKEEKKQVLAWFQRIGVKFCLMPRSEWDRYWRERR